MLRFPLPRAILHGLLLLLLIAWWWPSASGQEDMPAEASASDTVGILSVPDGCQAANTLPFSQDMEVLLAWKDTLPAGDCLGCRDGEVFRTWRRGVDVCCWNETARTTDGLELRGVLRCDDDSQRVKKLELGHMNLFGPLPLSFKQFERMADLYLEGNSFTGTIPEVWSTVGIRNRNVDVRLSGNDLTGPLPLSWSSHPTFKNLEFNDNKFRSSLPPEWSAMLKLAKIEVQDSLLTGTLPREWSGLPALSKLEVAGNNISGTLPMEYSAATNLEEVRFNENMITGTLPPEWSALILIESLRLGENYITGTLPPQWSLLAQLDSLHVEDNAIQGTLPPQWSNMTILEELDLSNNKLTGTVPPEIVGLAAAGSGLVLDISMNDLQVGDTPYPESWTVSPQLQDATPTAPPAVVDNTPSGGTGTNTAAVAVGVAVALSVLVIAAAVLFLLLHRRHRRHQEAVLKGAGYLEAGSASTVSRWVKGSSLSNTQVLAMSLQKYREPLSFEEVSQPIMNLHELMPDAYKSLPMRLLLVDYVLSCDSLPSFDELNELDGESQQATFYDIPYSSTSDELWNTTVVVSWRWSQPKPDKPERGFCPMSPLQLKQLQRSLVNRSEDDGVQYVWVDWCCVPQYCASPMPEIARSKVYYGRARAMKVVPGAEPLPEGSLRVVLSNVIRTLQEAEHKSSHPLRARHALADICLAGMSLKHMKDSGVLFKREYFGRVWTLAERMCRHGRNERLHNWLPLGVWLSMTLDALWASSEADAAEGKDGGDTHSNKSQSGPEMKDFYWDKLYDPDVARASINALRAMRHSGSHLVCETVNSEVASIFVAAVEGWKTRQVTEEVNVEWLNKYLCHEAGPIYQSWEPRDALWAIYSFFCWHIRSPWEFSAAHGDLCRVGGIPESSTMLCSLGDPPRLPPTVDDSAPRMPSVDESSDLHARVGLEGCLVHSGSMVTRS